MKSEQYYMSQALILAKRSMARGEVPVGAVIVDKDGTIIGRGYNLVESHKNQQSHAEMRALRSAVKKWGDWRLEGCTLYVTLEPCAMCLGAILLSRVSQVVYGAPSPQYGVVNLLGQLPQSCRAHTIIRQSLQPNDCVVILKRFFTNIRANVKDAS